MLPEVVFNSERREYLVIVNDRDVFNEYLNNVGYIIDGDGTPLSGPFPVGNQVGDFYAARGAYNPNNDTYLVVWEDFRHATDWLDTICEVYGALLDADGDMIDEIPIIDDYGLPEFDTLVMSEMHLKVNIWKYCFVRICLNSLSSHGSSHDIEMRVINRVNLF